MSATDVELSQVSTLRYLYDSGSDCGYIWIGYGDVARTESVTASLHVDRDGSGNIVGVEVLTVTDPSWMAQVTDLLAGSVPDASLVSARLQDMVSASPPGSRQEGPTVNSGLPAAGTTENTRVP